MKKTVLALLALSAGSSIAGTMGPVCTPGNVTVPCETQAWDVGLYALYLQPNYNGELGYPAVLQSGSDTQYVGWDSDWGWGFALEGSYHFNTGNDININWRHFDNDTAHRRLLTFNQVNADWDMASKAQWDMVNMELGQWVDFGQYKNIRFHGGAEYARIKDTGYFLLVGNTARSDMQASFNGFGPRTGMDMSYDWNNGFSIYANAAAALLVGTAQFWEITNADNVFYSGSRTAIVPEVDSKIGAKYDYRLAQGMLSLDGGWMFVNYFHANHTRGFFAGETDVSFNGPYLGLKWIGMV